MFKNPNIIYVPEIATYTVEGINDQVAIGSSYVIDKYCDIFYEVENYYRNHICAARPEIMFKYHLDKNHIPIQMNDIRYDIWRIDGTVFRQHKMHGEFLSVNFLRK